MHELTAIADLKTGIAGAIECRDLISAIICVGAVGFLAAIAFVVLGAPDLALTQVTVEILGLVILSLATIAVITLVFLLSQQLRKGEFHTLLRIGASRGYVGLLIASEIGFVFLISVLLAVALSLVTRHYAMQILQTVLTL